MQNDNHEAGTRSNLPSRCKNCKAPLEADEWHPTESVIPDEEDPEVFVFCDESCHGEWSTT
jgi:hypothetical protein